MLIYEQKADETNAIAIMEYDLTLPKGEIHVLPHIHRCGELSLVVEGGVFCTRRIGTENIKTGGNCFYKTKSIALLQIAWQGKNLCDYFSL